MTEARNITELSIPELVQVYASLALQQDDALLTWDVSKTNHLYQRMKAVELELKSRPGDQRTALLGLFDHPNPQVRLKAADATLAVAPTAARQVLESMREVNGPQRLHAGMTIRGLDDGSYKPT